MPKKHNPAATERLAELRAYLIDIGDALQEVSLDQLQQRGGWDWDLFESVLKHVEQRTPGFQSALADYLALPGEHSTDLITALLAVDRLSTAYTYWTRLFPPRHRDTSMFVLSLLQDLSDKVEYAIQVVDQMK
jgi:hypothetical protein